jgi:hypothetical protein
MFILFLMITYKNMKKAIFKACFIENLKYDNYEASRIYHLNELKILILNYTEI